MTFNNIINHLKLWCKKKAGVYETVHDSHGGTTYVGYLLAYELQFKLSTLVDMPFESTTDLKRAVLELLDIHYEPYVLNPPNDLAKHIIDKINREFREFLEELFADKDSLATADIPYQRAIIGPEAEALIEKFRSVWKYVNTSYWFPLMGNEPEGVPEKFFIMLNRLEPYMKQLEKILGLPQTHIYCYGEDISRPNNCLETVELIAYGGLESIYTDKDFTWAIYFSHENTIAFAGAIVPKVKELLSAEKEHWNKFEWDWMV